MKIQLFIFATLYVASSLQEHITSIWKNNLLTTIPKWGREWRVSFEVRPISKIGPWANIIHFTKGGGCCGLGQRIPAVFFLPNSLRLSISSGVGGEGNQHWDAGKDLPLNKFTSVVIKQVLNPKNRRYTYSISLDGKVVRSRHQTNPVIWKNVKVYAGSPYDMAAKAVLRNLHITVEPDLTGNIIKGRLLTTIPVWGKEWRLSFKIKPLSAQPKWTNILHLTNGKNSGHPGSRIPGIWLPPSTTRMYVSTQLGTDNNYRYTTPKNLSMIKYTNVHIEQVMNKHGKYVYKIIIDGKVVRSVLQTKPTDYKNVKLYASDPWNGHADVYVRDLHLQGISGSHFFTTFQRSNKIVN